VTASALMKLLVRVLAGLFIAAFVTLSISIAACPPDREVSFCGPRPWVRWAVCFPLVFILLFFGLSERLKRYRRYAVVALLGLYGIYGLTDPAWWHSWWVVPSIALLIAALGVALKFPWARSLVWMLAAVFVVLWVYSIWAAERAGYFLDSSAGVALLSLVPGSVFLLAAIFCCYVVETEPPRPIAAG